VTGQPAASGAFPKNASPPLRTQEHASARQSKPATPIAIPTAPHASVPASQNQLLDQPQESPKSPIHLPPKVLRLKANAILCFHRLTMNFNRILVAIKPLIFRPAERAARAPNRFFSDNNFSRAKSSARTGVVPATRRVLASRLQVGHAGMSLPHHAFRRSDPSLRRPIEDNHENLHHRCDS
jgi:hypothetical protein